jgi:hypothetical protein
MEMFKRGTMRESRPEADDSDSEMPSMQVSGMGLLARGEEGEGKRSGRWWFAVGGSVRAEGEEDGPKEGLRFPGRRRNLV